MDDRWFDALTRELGSGRSRRSVIRGMLGLGAIAAGFGIERAEAARRGFPGPTLPTLPTPPPCGQTGATCGSNTACCSGRCCNGQCIAADGCCIDLDCATTELCALGVCTSNHTCTLVPDPACEPDTDCSVCDFDGYCACLPICMELGGTISEIGVCIEDLCKPHLEGCPQECVDEGSCTIDV